MILHAILYPFFPTWFCSFNFARDLVTLGTKAWTWQVSKIPVFPMLSESLEKTHRFLKKKAWDDSNVGLEKIIHIEKATFGVFFGGSWMKGYLVEKMRIASESNLFCAASFFLQTRDTWKWRDRTPVFFRILKGTFQWKFHLQAKGVQTCQIEHL